MLTWVWVLRSLGGLLFFAVRDEEETGDGEEVVYRLNINVNRFCRERVMRVV
jgi:hypothetical protein